MNIYRKLIVFVLLINMNQEIINMNSENINNNSKEEDNNKNNSLEGNLENNANIEDIKFYSFQNLNESVNENIDDNNIEFYKKLIESILEMESKFNNLSANQKKNEIYKKNFADFKTHFTIPSLTDISKLFMSIKHKKDIENLTHEKIINITDKEEKNKEFIRCIIFLINKYFNKISQNNEINMDNLKIRLFFYIYLQQYTFAKNKNNDQYVNIIKNNINAILKDVTLKIKNFLFILKQTKNNNFYLEKDPLTLEKKDKYSNIKQTLNYFFPKTTKKNNQQQLKYLTEIIDSIINIDCVTIQIDEGLNQWLDKKKIKIINKLNKGQKKNKIEQDSNENNNKQNKNYYEEGFLNHCIENIEEEQSINEEEQSINEEEQSINDQLKQNNQTRKINFNHPHPMIKKIKNNNQNNDKDEELLNELSNYYKLIIEKKSVEKDIISKINTIINEKNQQYFFNQPLIKGIVFNNDNKNADFEQIILKYSNEILDRYNKQNGNIFKKKITGIILEEQQDNNQNINQFLNNL